MYADDFRAAALRLDPVIGSVNTIILLTSSLTVVLAIVAFRRNQKLFSTFNAWLYLSLRNRIS